MALTDTLRQPLGWGASHRPAGAQKLWQKLTRSLESGRVVPVTIRSDDPFEGHEALAAAPARYVLEDDEGTTIWLHVPSAGAKNTQVVWDPERRQLGVGVWASPVDGITGSPRKPSRLLWYASVWQPDADGRQATASVIGGWARVRWPRARPARARPN